MPKTKIMEKSTEKGVEKKSSRPSDDLEKIIGQDSEDKEDIELIQGEASEEDAEEEEAVLDAEEIDPFKDKWEE